jgi:peptidylprolyl isomerase
MKTFAVAMVTLALAITMVGCGGQVKNLPPLPPGTNVTCSGQEFENLKLGSGVSSKMGDVVTVNYEVYTSDNKKVESTLDSGGAPVEFAIGGGSQISGLEEGVAGMRVGGQRRLTIPPELAYGDTGKPPSIPAGATLVYYVDVVSLKAMKVLPSGVGYVDLTVGTGESPQTYDDLIVNYTGWLASGNTKFESTLDEGKQPLRITLGTAQVVQGWDTGLVGMKIGGKRRLTIPYNLGYGGAGRSPDVPAYANLAYEVELLDIKPPVTTASGLKYHDYVVGTGSAPSPGDTVAVDYTGWLTDGTQFDSSLLEGRDPLIFVLNGGEVIPGFNEAVSTMRVNGRRKVIIPPNLAYGSAGSSPSIPPNATLVFQLELKNIKPE